MSFRGITKDYVKVLRGRKRPPWAPIERSILEIPGLAGGYLSNSKVKPRVISVPVLLKKKNFPDLQKLKEDLADWLITDKEEPLIFDDEEDRTYYAVVNDELDLDEMVRYGHGTIEFICPDPYKYGEEQSHEFTNNILNVTNNGTAEAKPIIELEATEPVTFAMISNGKEEYNSVGTPVDVDENEPVDELTSILNKRLDDFVGFSDVATGHTFNDPLGGIVAGKFQLGNGQWMVTDYGSNPNGWHGPSKKTSFSESLQDFQIDHYITQLNFAGQLGKNVLFLEDENNNIVASLGAVDKTIASGYYNKIQFYLGGQKLMFDFEGFNNTRMWLRLRRQGALFTATAYQLREDGTAYNKVTRTFEDRLSEYQAPIRQASVYMATFKEYAATRMYANRIQANRVNDLGANQIPYIAEFGDKIVFDFVNEVILINGEPRMDIKGFGGTFFTLAKGSNQLTVTPNSFNTKIKYRPRFL
ncbi:distal tail protein Dit [Virgibacillus salarius]|uniref:distal tail protein Dit n=1 Tax=Virgibacillus salarius TaxID=447199 RepID=UPI0031E0BA20